MRGHSCCVHPLPYLRTFESPETEMGFGEMMENMDVKLFVIIVTYKGKQWYDRCFTSLRQSTMPVQTIVVDNASNDGTVEYIRENFPEVILMENKENLGFGRANNVAMRYALDHGCDYVFLLNQDAWVEADTFEKMVDIHQRHEEYGILGCINIDKEKKHMLGGFVHGLFHPSNCPPSLIDDMYFSRLGEVYSIKSIPASAWLLSKKILEEVGGFDPVFFHYGEDDNYLQRALYHGFKVGVCPHCPIVHDAASGRVKEAVDFRKAEYAQPRNWLLEWCNPFGVSSINGQSRQLFYKFLTQCLQFNFGKASYYWRKYRYFKDNKKAILKSLEVNVTKGCHYLV